ncbi:MAG: peptidase S16 [Rhodospirillaceae bacterium]|nr:MAG: peptidase S16 [Rhodospirillaceae bacterium]
MFGGDLPEAIPIFPLSGALLLPRGVLPLTIFEPRYLRMVSNAMANERMIGMIQPLVTETPAGKPDLYQTGCVGRITAFNETEGGHFLIMLTGVSRFDIARELPEHDGYRRVIADYSRFSEDPKPEPTDQIDRSHLLDVLRLFIKRNAVEVEWEAVTALADEPLVISLTMTCPFAANEKQALLECQSLAERSRVLTTLLEMTLLAPDLGVNAQPN